MSFTNNPVYSLFPTCLSKELILKFQLEDTPNRKFDFKNVFDSISHWKQLFNFETKVNGQV